MNTDEVLAGIDGATDEQLAKVAQRIAPHLNKSADMHYQAERITIPSGTAAGNVVRTSLTLDSRFKRCNGIVAYLISSQANPDHLVAIRDNNRTHIEKTSHKVLSADERTPINDRFMSVNLSADGLKIYVETEVGTTLSQDLKFDIVFRLVDPK